MDWIDLAKVVAGVFTGGVIIRLYQQWRKGRMEGADVAIKRKREDVRLQRQQDKDAIGMMKEYTQQLKQDITDIKRELGQSRDGHQRCLLENGRLRVRIARLEKLHDIEYIEPPDDEIPTSAEGTSNGGGTNTGR